MQYPNIAHSSTNTVPKVKYWGGSILLWGCIFSVGTGHLGQINGANKGDSLRKLGETSPFNRPKQQKSG